MSFHSSSIISADQFSINDIEHFCVVAEKMRNLVEERGVLDILSDKVMATLFYEPSTRTRLSFEASMKRLGGKVISTSDAKHYSSVTKGETVEDTIRTVQQYADVIVLRHTQRGSATLAQGVAEVPIINAGDGDGEHPTQALLDIYTIKREKKKLNGLTVAMIGDLKYGRTVHSLSQLLGLYAVRQVFISPRALSIPSWVKDKISVPFEESDDVELVIEQADVFYITRLQKERFEDKSECERYQGIYRFTSEILSRAKSSAIIMHPLPRMDEISADVDADPRAAYFRQVKNGMFMRMALLASVFGRDEISILN